MPLYGKLLKGNSGVRQKVVMKKSLLFLILTLFIAGMAIESAEAQPKRKKRRPSSRRGKAMPKRSKYFSFGGGIGYNNYFGDLSPASGIGSSSFNGVNLYFGAVGEYRFHPNFSARAGLAYTMLSASDASADPAGDASTAGRYARNLHFRNNMIEFSSMITANIFPVNRGYLKRAKVNPFVFLGLNVFTNNPQARAFGKGNTGDWINLRELKTEGQGTTNGPQAYSGLQVGIPFGVGVKFAITRKIDISFELGYRFTFTNYLDDVGVSYLTEAEMRGSNPTTVRMSNRSAELVDNFGKARTYNGVPITNVLGDPSKFKTISLSDGSSFTYQVGTEAGRMPRGGPSPDYWLTTAVHLHYIIGSSKGGPRRR
jgi:hypothetical protein